MLSLNPRLFFQLSLSLLFSLLLGQPLLFKLNGLSFGEELLSRLVGLPLLFSFQVCLSLHLFKLFPLLDLLVNFVLNLQANSHRQHAI